VRGGNGTFSGEGEVKVPFFNNAKGRVKFDNIVVNTDRRMVKGEMEVTGGEVDILPANVMNAIDELSQAMKETDSLLNTARQFVTPPPVPSTFIADEVISVPAGIKSVYKDVATGKLIVTDNTGKTQSLPSDKNLVLTDGTGGGVIVAKSGGATNVSASDMRSILNRELNPNLMFSNSADSRYGMDIQKIGALKKNYEQLGPSYLVPFKAVAVGATDGVSAALITKGIDINKVKIDQDGVVLDSKVVGENITLNATVKSSGDNAPIIARMVDEKTNKETIVGKLNVAGYVAESLTLHIVPVNGTTVAISKTEIENQLNGIYTPAVVSWSVTMETNLKVDGLATPFDNGSSGVLSTYTGDMKTVINSYLNTNKLSDDNYYLFLVPKGTNVTESGYMPRSKQCGFIFLSGNEKDATPVIRTMAHELGHGAFTLEHTFADYTALAQGSTDNLMDYGTGTTLWKYQWDRIHHPRIVLGLFESDEAGASKANKSYTLGYVISDPTSYKRLNIPPYQIIEPREALTRGKEIALLNTAAQGKMSFVRFLDLDPIYVTSSSNISRIIKLSKPEKYQVTGLEECSVLPYSSDKTGHIPEKDSYVIANKVCGDYYQIKEDALTNHGWWINKNSLKRVGNDVANNFDWMTNVSVSDESMSKEILGNIIANRSGINDRTDKDIYGQNAMISIGKGFFYLGKDTGYPELSGTEFEKHLKKIILDELGKEGSYSSINTYDGEIFTWGKGFAISGSLMDVFENLTMDKSINAIQIFNNIGIQISEGTLKVLDSEGHWLKDVMPAKKKEDYKASNYIRSNKQLLSFFIEFAEKKDYQKSIVNAQYKVFTESAGKYPDYIVNKTKTGYDLNWSDESVTVLAHLSHWCGYSWSNYTYKETNGDLSKILYKYVYNTAVLFPGTRYGAVLESNIYRWDGTNYYLLQRLSDFGIPKSIGLTTLEQTWSSHLIQTEFKTDKSKKLRALQNGTKNYISNPESVLIPKESGHLVLTKNSTTVTYGTFEE
jgi:hypothetical protein